MGSGISFNEYIDGVLQTESNDWGSIASRLLGINMKVAEGLDMTFAPKLRLLHGAFGVVTEAGELADALKKHIYYDKPLDIVNIAEELGDIMWYIALIVCYLEYNLIQEIEKGNVKMREVPERVDLFSEILKINLKKLAQRYGKQFSPDSALSRVLSKERTILEELKDNLTKQAVDDAKTETE